jgi:hypothetical protein
MDEEEEEEEDFDRPRLLISHRLREATNGISLSALGTLTTLIRIAANAGTTAIPVSEGNIAPYFSHAADRAAFRSYFAELRLRGLIRETRPGIFEIAPGFWKVAVWDLDDTEFFPFSG